MTLGKTNDVVWVLVALVHHFVGFFKVLDERTKSSALRRIFLKRTEKRILFCDKVSWVEQQF